MQGTNDLLVIEKKNVKIRLGYNKLHAVWTRLLSISNWTFFSKPCLTPSRHRNFRPSNGMPAVEIRVSQQMAPADLPPFTSRSQFTSIKHSLTVLGGKWPSPLSVFDRSSSPQMLSKLSVFLLSTWVIWYSLFLSNGWLQVMETRSQSRNRVWSIGLLMTKV